MRNKLIAAVLAAFCLLALPVRVCAAAAPEPIRIAFVDSGISTRHIDPDHVAEGKNYVFPDSDTLDRIGHGTATAGIVLGAADQGVTGVCPEAVAIPLVVMDAYPSGVIKNGGTEALCQAIMDAVDIFRCQIINISLSAAEDTQALHDAVDHAEAQGVLVVSAVGNDGAEGSDCYPAAYDPVIAVGAADGDRPASFSQRGADLLAAGVQLTAATHRSSLRPTTVSGTSYSCALVTGFCARLLQQYPGLAPAAARQALYCLADDLGAPGYDAESGWGLIQTGRTIPDAFSDVGTESWMFPGAFYAAAHGLMNGVGSGSFAPDASLTRAMSVTILWRMAGQPPTETPVGFLDVAADAWFADAVRWAAQAGIVSGYDAELFGPDDNLSREQLAVMLFRYAAYIAAEDAENAPAPETAAEETALDRFADAGEISPWATDAMRWAVDCGALTGIGADRISPLAPATRAQVATILMRLDPALSRNDHAG